MLDHRVSQLEDTVRKQTEIIDALRDAYESKADRVEVMKALSFKASEQTLTQARAELTKTSATLTEDLGKGLQRLDSELNAHAANTEAHNVYERLSALEDWDVTGMVEERCQVSEQRTEAERGRLENNEDRLSLAEVRLVDTNQTMKKFADILESYKRALTNHNTRSGVVRRTTTCLAIYTPPSRFSFSPFASQQAHTLLPAAPHCARGRQG
jgi:hypothetical protein